jgi:hypothetical protein
MPNKDGTGPEGKGPLSGRKMGNCEGAETEKRRCKGGQGRGLGRRMNC